MKNAQSIYYLIAATVVIIVVNTIFSLFQSSRNEQKYQNLRQTYDLIESSNSLLTKVKDAEAELRAYVLSKDSIHFLQYKKEEDRINDIYRSLYSSLSHTPEQEKNLNRLNHLLKQKRKYLEESMRTDQKSRKASALITLDNKSSQSVMLEIKSTIADIIQVEKASLGANNSSISKLTKKLQVFSVISNWILLVIVISGLISIIHNRQQISRLFKEVEQKNEILEIQKSELQGLSQDLIKQNHELERFAYVASHDLRSPGVNLIALLQLYEEAKDESEKADLMEIIKEVADNQIVKLDDLIDMLKSKHDSSAIHEELTFSQIYKNVVKNLSADIKKSKATLNYDFTEAPTVKYPKSYLESIIQNLLSNAIKYRHPKKEPRISIRTYHINDITFMEVKDNGLGIDLKKHGDNIFGIYQTFHEHNNSKGVGLYITKAQVVAMGGNIEVDSSPDEGTTFRINFN